VLFVCVLRPVLARGLLSRVSGETWVVSRVSYLALTASFVSKFACFKVLTALPPFKIYKQKIHLGHIAEFERFVFCMSG
jgi:hypothetical protein